jgi:hypothetical protein
VYNSATSFQDSHPAFVQSTAEQTIEEPQVEEKAEDIY